MAAACEQLTVADPGDQQQKPQFQARERTNPNLAISRDLMPEMHLAVFPTCIACYSSIKIDEIVLALLGDKRSMRCNGYTRPFPFPQRGLVPSKLQDYQPCRYPSCSRCAKSPEAFTAHVDCFKLFMESCTSVNRLQFLFTVAAWKSPWPRAVPIDWNTTKAKICITALACVARRYGIPELEKTPVEVLYMIRQLSADTLLWRYMSVLEFAKQLSAAQTEGLVELSLSQLAFWERGSKPLLMGSGSSPNIFRLGIDLKGIKRVERLDKYPGTIAAAGDCFAFIIEKDENLRDVIAQFKDGLLRLTLPVSTRGLRLWDTPYPPLLNVCQFFPRHPSSGRRIRTISLNDITGLTFFCSSAYGRFLAVHAHTSKMPSALSTFERLPDRLQQCVYWIYLPLTSPERIIAIGSRRASQPLSDILIKTSLTGVHFLVPCQSGPGKAISLGKGPPTTLLYEEPECGNPISTIGVYCADYDSNKHLTEEFLHPPPPECQLVDKDIVYHSSASLENVKCARVFLATEDGPCMGILFEYDNGSQRAVGQCAPFFWPERRFYRPLWFYHRSVQGTFGLGILVSFALGPLRDEDCPGFLCRRMAGTVTIWTGWKTIALVVDNDSKIKK